MLTPVPTRVDDKKDAVLWSVFDKLQKIDENQGTRIAFAQNIAITMHMQLQASVFADELKMLREVLNIPEPKEEIAAKEEVVRSEMPNPSDSLKFADL